MKEVVAVLRARDFDVVRRYMELHMERLEETFAEQRRAVAMIENRLLALVEANIRPKDAGDAPPNPTEEMSAMKGKDVRTSAKWCGP